MNHTPGPWRVGRQDIPIGYFPIYARTGITNISCVARTDAHEVGFGISEKEHRANARLIAAAPELYEALENLLEAVIMSEKISIEAGFKARVRARDILLKLREEGEENA